MLKETKTQIIEANRRSEADTGSPEVQVAILTTRIKDLTEHLKVPFPSRSSEDGRSAQKHAELSEEEGHHALPRHHRKARSEKVIRAETDGGEATLPRRAMQSHLSADARQMALFFAKSSQRDL